ncbi:TPR repeat protein-like protein [Cucurbitaria berberidis CBS 394.84]|uniref:TPR repeat protein-like protein n=1 Tax=Cucurbitaria berberidis CBS 394.84 TaxID=1168544 RepID=A0A9P4GLF7_9PLEO|nr:TPR repeat protein-like protein [Cucurbitaria berberidis CBS 394.84]KAF1848503.1 TPR repeat protein-like protein [Cucurbitaria berberidis CBS 394.84]
MAQQSNPNGAQQASADMPPAMAEVKSQSVDELLKEMNRMPLFMTQLDETDGEGGENLALEALKAMAYEGTRAEVAENFRQQGNECARAKQWVDAKEFYNKAIAALKGPQNHRDPDAAGPDVIEVELDEEEEAKKEKVIEEACYVNRALCNLEKKNYRSCILDCAATLRVNPSNIKAFYRSGTACLALDKLLEATWACGRGLAIDSNNAPLIALHTKIAARKAYIESVEKARRAREEKAASERATLNLALKSRNILTRMSGQPPDLEDAAIKLEDVMDPSSTLTFPVILLYPTHSQSDFIKAFSEREKLDQHLDYIFPLPWDEQHVYTIENVEAYMETAAGGLIKVGKKMSLGKVLGSGKTEIVDGLVRISVLPKDKAADWIEEFKKRRGKAISYNKS